jgi:hypothetical protein
LRRAFYLLPPGGWRDFYNILHLPYTVWHLSYVVLGAALVARPDYGVLMWTVIAFLLAMGVGAHCVDELRGRPLRTTIPEPVLWTIGLAATGVAVVIGVVVGIPATPLVVPFIIAGAFLVFAYNLEWPAFHNDAVFAFSWGAFPVLTSFVVQNGDNVIGCLVIAACAAAMSHVQRVLSTRARHLRRRVLAVSGQLVDREGRSTPVTAEWLLEDHERVLAILSLTMPALALGLLLR